MPRAISSADSCTAVPQYDEICEVYDILYVLVAAFAFLAVLVQLARITQAQPGARSPAHPSAYDECIFFARANFTSANDKVSSIPCAAACALPTARPPAYDARRSLSYGLYRVTYVPLYALFRLLSFSSELQARCRMRRSRIRTRAADEHTRHVRCSFIVRGLALIPTCVDMIPVCTASTVITTLGLDMLAYG